MKVFFIGSPRHNWIEQQRIYTLLKSLKLKHTCLFTENIDPEEFYRNTTEELWADRYKSRLKEISVADFCVFEASTPSHAIGQLVQEALGREKPVIVLHTKDYVPHFLSGTVGKEKRLQLLEYSESNLSAVLEYAIGVVKELLEIRFTMLMSAEINTYLERKAKEFHLSRSEYIRGLVRKDMEQE
jgi:hypothetical protein